MIEVLRRGIPPSEIRWRGECHICKSDLRATAQDLKVDAGDYRSEGPFAHGICPICKASVVFHPEESE